MNADRFGSLSGGAYRKPGTVTGSNPVNFTEMAPTPSPANTMINRNELTTVYDSHTAAGVNTVQKTDFDVVAPAPHQPNHWVYGRDPYKHHGMPGEAYLDNSTTPAGGDSDSVAPVIDGGPAQL